MSNKPTFAMNPEKLAKLQEQVRIGGKGTPRRKTKKPTKGPVDDKKLGGALKKVGLQNIPAIDEVNMFLEDETVLHFGAPKELTELAPGIIEQLSPESLDRLRQMANAYLQMTKDGTNLTEESIPELIQNFEAQNLSGKSN